MHRMDGWLVGTHGLQRGTLHYDTHIRSIDLQGDVVVNPTDDAPRILPGFIDPHVHGGGGGDTMDGADGIRTLAKFHLRHGSTTLLPTTITNPWDKVEAALAAVAEVRNEQASPANEVLPDLPGAHLEGPFISPDRLGAQPPHTVLPTAERVARVLAHDVVRVVTIAPEIEGATEAAVTMARAGVRISVGHTRASADEVRHLADAVRAVSGTVGFTHLFNAMGGLGGREPGIVGACLSDPEAFAELILDTHHVHPTSFRATYAALGPRLLLVTDAIRATGMGDGPSELGGQRIEVRDGSARLQSGTLAGSVLTMDGALRHAVTTGIPLSAAARMTSTAAADYLGLADRGRLAVNLRADLAVVGPDLELQRVVSLGRDVPGVG